MGIGWTELFVVVLVALLVFGPKELPRAMRAAGGFMNTVRRLSEEFRKQFDEALREAERDVSGEAVGGKAPKKSNDASDSREQQPGGEGPDPDQPEEAKAKNHLSGLSTNVADPEGKRPQAQGRRES